MPSLDFKGKSFIYTHHLGVPYRELLVVPEKSEPPLSDESDERGDTRGHAGTRGDTRGHAGKMVRRRGPADCKTI